MAPFAEDRAQELKTEKALLLKAERDIEEGWTRLHHQQNRLFNLRTAGHDTEQAEHLAKLLKQILVEWEQHRSLIERRVAYLREEVLPPYVAGR